MFCQPMCVSVYLYMRSCVFVYFCLPRFGLKTLSVGLFSSRASFWLSYSSCPASSPKSLSFASFPSLLTHNPGFSFPISSLSGIHPNICAFPSQPPNSTCPVLWAVQKPSIYPDVYSADDRAFIQNGRIAKQHLKENCIKTKSALCRTELSSNSPNTCTHAHTHAPSPPAHLISFWELKRWVISFRAAICASHRLKHTHPLCIISVTSSHLFTADLHLLLTPVGHHSDGHGAHSSKSSSSHPALLSLYLIVALPFSYQTLIFSSPLCLSESSHSN